MSSEMILRFVVGGIAVSLFSLLGDLFRPRSFAGLFDAAPSVAVATLALTVAHKDAFYAAIEARSMILGAVALMAYSMVVSRLLVRNKCSSLAAASLVLPLWLVTALGLWWVLVG